MGLIILLAFCIVFKYNYKYIVNKNNLSDCLFKYIKFVIPVFQYNAVYVGCIQIKVNTYSQDCIKRSWPLGQRNSGLLRQVTILIFISGSVYMKFFHDMARQRWSFNTGDCLIEVTTWVGLTVYGSLTSVHYCSLM